MTTIAAEPGRPARSLHIAVLCRVIDNLGDAGVCWRLCRQLVREHDCRVTLFIDDRAALAQVLDTTGRLPDVEDWPTTATALPAVDALICAFACEPPPAWRTRLAP